MSFDTHARWMDEALTLARAGLGDVWPNPSVGCLIVAAGGHVVGRGSTQPGGRPHAEVVALREAGERARGATAVISLEPCCHYGQTPPCTRALIEARIARCIVAIEDPDPRVNGAGIEELTRAGIETRVGIRADRAREMNAGFFCRVRTGRPLVMVGRHAEAMHPDAILGGEPGRILVTLRRPGAPPPPAEGPLPAALRALGDAGLTRVFVAEGTPLAQALLKSGLVDRHPDPRDEEDV
jgi:pyrimidine deaminase RibD-like protein